MKVHKLCSLGGGLRCLSALVIISSCHGIIYLIGGKGHNIRQSDFNIAR